MLERRRFLMRSGCCIASVASIIKFAAGSFSVADTANNKAEISAQDEESILTELFDTAQSAQDGSLRIDLPVEVVNPDIIPFRVAATDAERLAVLIQGNQWPLLLKTEVEHRAYCEITGMFRLEQGGEFSCYALRNGKLYKNTQTVRWHGFRNPGKRRRQAIVQPAASTVLRAEPSRDGYNILVSIRHGQHKRLGDMPYVRQAIYSVNEQTVSNLEFGPSISPNPLIGLHLKSLKMDDVIKVAWQDSDDTEGRAIGTLELILHQNLYREA